MIMPWGKNRGKRISDIDTNYLAWCLANADALKSNEELRRAIENELAKRRAGGGWQNQQGSRPEPTSGRMDHPGIAAWKKAWPKLVRLAHPDCGGSHELMLTLNEINDVMKAK